MKAVAVCPEGKELEVEPSGRSSAAEYLIPLTKAAINTAEKALLASKRPHCERPS